MVKCGPFVANTCGDILSNFKMVWLDFFSFTAGYVNIDTEPYKVFMKNFRIFSSIYVLYKRNNKQVEEPKVKC